MEHSEMRRNTASVSTWQKGRGGVLLVRAVMMCVAASKKKNLEIVKVLTTMTMEAIITATKLVMFIARMMLRMTKPGPARRLLEKGIFPEELRLRKWTGGIRQDGSKEGARTHIYRADAGEDKGGSCIDFIVGLAIVV
jgi:hypothetical protein